jgi:rhodanese-related sulfurtransferase
MSDKEKDKEKEDHKEVKTCLICKPAGDLSTEEIPYWSKKQGNYSPYPKMITCDAKYALEKRDEMVEETPIIKDKAIELKMKFGEGSSEKWAFYFASNEQEDPLEIKTPKEAYGQDENRGLVKTDKDGKATFKLNCPQPYRAEGTTYCRHVHYLIEEDGVWLPMRTTRVICEIELEKLDKVLKDKTALVINALDFKDYDKDKIPGSVNLPVSELEKLGSEEKEKRVLDFLKDNIKKLKPIEDKVKEKKLDIKDVPIVTYCARKQCKASEKLLDQLYECGVNNVLEFSGGMELWNKERTFFGEGTDEEESEGSEGQEKKEKSDDESDKESSSSSDSDDSDEEDEEDDDDESEEGGIEVEYEGVKYLYDKENKELCNLEADVVADADYKDGKLTNVKWKEGEKDNHESNSDYEKEESEEPEEEGDEEKEESDEEDDDEEDDDEEPVEEGDDEESEEREEPEEEEESEEESEESEESEEPEEESEEPEEEKGEVFTYTDEKLRVKTVPQLKELVIKMTQRKGGTYSFPIGKKKYRTKGQIINLIQTCQGKSAKKSKFYYLDEDELHSLKLSELKDHVKEMITREEGSYKFALSNFKKDDLIDTILACQGDPVQGGGGLQYKKKYKGYGWGFMF